MRELLIADEHINEWVDERVDEGHDNEHDCMKDNEKSVCVDKVRGLMKNVTMNMKTCTTLQAVLLLCVMLRVRWMLSVMLLMVEEGYVMLLA